MGNTKCAHPACHCHIGEDAYCSDTCREVAKAPLGSEPTCPCGHAECKATLTEVS